MGAEPNAVISWFKGNPEPLGIVSYRFLVNDNGTVHFNGYDVAVFHLPVPDFQVDLSGIYPPLPKLDIASSVGAHLATCGCRRGVCTFDFLFFHLCFWGRRIVKRGNHYRCKSIGAVVEIEGI